MAANKILIVDADLASRNYIAGELHKAGYPVLQAASGKEALIAAWRDHPDLIIVDPVLPDLKGEELIGRLHSDARTAAVPLIALSSDPQQSRARSCMQAGFKEYLVKTAQAVPALLGTVNRLTTGASVAAREGGLLLVFMSAKGGTGTSSLCANVAMNIAQYQPEARIVLVDMVLPIGSVSEIVGYEGDQNLVTIADLPASETTPEFFRQRLVEMENWHFHLLAGSPDPETGNELNVGRIGEIIQSLKNAYDFILLDLGRSLSRISLPLIEQADLLALIVSTDVSTVNLTKTVWDYLHSKGVQASSVFIILNRAVGLEGLTKSEAEKIIGIPIKTAMPYLGGNFALANNLHQPISLKFPKDTASIVLKEAAEQMVNLARHLRNQ